MTTRPLGPNNSTLHSSSDSSVSESEDDELTPPRLDKQALDRRRSPPLAKGILVSLHSTSQYFANRRSSSRASDRHNNQARYLASRRPHSARKGELAYINDCDKVATFVTILHTGTIFFHRIFGRVKAQGTSLQKAIVDVTSARNVQYGYMMLSRATSLKNLATLTDSTQIVL